MSFRDFFRRKEDVAKEQAEREAEAKAAEARAPKPVEAKRVFAEGLCDLCQKAMHEHGEKDCRDQPIVLIDEPDHVRAARADAERQKV